MGRKLKSSTGLGLVQMIGLFLGIMILGGGGLLAMFSAIEKSRTEEVIPRLTKIKKAMDAHYKRHGEYHDFELLSTVPNFKISREDTTYFIGNAELFNPHRHQGCMARMITKDSQYDLYIVKDGKIHCNDRKDTGICEVLRIPSPPPCMELAKR